MKTGKPQNLLAVNQTLADIGKKLKENFISYKF